MKEDINMGFFCPTKILFIIILFQQTSLTESKKGLEINTDSSKYKKLQLNKPLELTCKNNVDPSMNVIWIPPDYVASHMYNLDLIEDKKLYTLTIDTPNRKHAGRYTCISYTNEGHQITEYVEVGVPPIIEKLLVNGNEAYDNQKFQLNGNDPVILKCIYDQYTYPKPRYEWKKDNVIIERENSDTLTVNEIGTYGCIVKNSINKVQHNIKILSMGCQCIAANACLGISIMGSLFASVTWFKKRWEHWKIISPSTFIIALLIVSLVTVQNTLGWNFNLLCITEITLFSVLVLIIFIIIHLKFYQDFKFSTTKSESDNEVGSGKEIVNLLNEHPDEPQSLKKQEKEVHLNNKIARPKENKQKSMNYENCQGQLFKSVRSDDVSNI